MEAMERKPGWPTVDWLWAWPTKSVQPKWCAASTDFHIIYQDHSFKASTPSPTFFFCRKFRQFSVAAIICFQFFSKRKKNWSCSYQDNELCHPVVDLSSSASTDKGFLWKTRKSWSYIPHDVDDSESVTLKEVKVVWWWSRSGVVLRPRSSQLCGPGTWPSA